MEVKKLELVDVMGSYECDLFNYGRMRDSIGWFNYVFYPGIYVLKGEFGTGGWALTEVICGRDKGFSGKIIFNGRSIDWLELQEISCYVGDKTKIKGQCFGEKQTIHKQIDYAVSKGLAYGKSVEEIILSFLAGSTCMM